ncbi:MAG: mannose-1-phosphate guanylyltransferase [Syntrophorhabdales bacterium]|jgi:mannose-1-phosphate guanylyltransferase
MEHTYCVIMAGGKGERFWPLSTAGTPKPFIKLIGDKTMIQMTVQRVAALVPKERIFVVLGAEHVDVARRQLPELSEGQFIVEPEGRDTGPCIGFAALLLHRLDPEAVMVVLPADQYIPDTDAFVATASVAAGCARQGDHLVTIGITPTRPEVGYGYICAGDRTGIAQTGSCFRVRRFVEKPDEVKAAHYLADGNYFWNSGIFVWRTAVVLVGIERHMPELYKGLRAIEGAVAAGRSQEVAEGFKGFHKISIDYGLMEKADNVLMVKADFAWDDVGTWGSLQRVMELDETGNYLRGNPVCVDTTGCMIYGEGVPVGVLGVSNLIIVASRQGVLVCDMGRDQETRQIARMIEQAKAEGASNIASCSGTPAGGASACGPSPEDEKSA